MKKKIIIVFLIILLIYALGGIYYNYFYREEPTVIKTLSKIEGYNYELRTNATELEKAEFAILKENLENSVIDENAYLESIAKLFIINLYTLNNKINKYDIGSIDYILPSYIPTYKLKVENTIYKYIEDNSDGKREQQLPEVLSITIDNVESITYEYQDYKYEAFNIKISWKYLEDLDYDKEALLTIIKENNIYYVVEKNDLKKE